MKYLMLWPLNTLRYTWWNWRTRKLQRALRLWGQVDAIEVDWMSPYRHVDKQERTW